MKLITPDKIQFSASISEDELRRRMAFEVMEQIGALDDAGKPLAGIQWSIHRGDGRARGYKITISGPAPARIALPKSADPPR